MTEKFKAGPQPGDDVKVGATKFDAGKSSFYNGVLKYFPRALSAVADVSDAGFKKYQAWGGWRAVPDGHARYSDAMARHIRDEACGEVFDKELQDNYGCKVRHAAQIAWNALARLELELAKEEQEKTK